MHCDHPFDSLVYHPEHVWYSGGARQQKPSFVTCSACREHLLDDISAADFLHMRGGQFTQQTGMDSSLTRDMFYRELNIGDLVVYPAMSGRSAQIIPGEIVEINPNRKADPLSPDELLNLQARARVGEPYSLKIRPTGAGSRWKQHGRWNASDTEPIRPVTLWANAGSAVLVK